ncbi:GNAT family N-acetyltransferase [Alkalicoccobacillus porphyridii]|uniref:GNAT family N-acetyltransferase n=1 Tax=Alkalicoccobacillus porphyridii TaxID=2597270 RepID=A0A553ZWV7_9BACI|nr:GNAT family N-acetyltransferase [Alkalicoccobacillus porphyridii]TSB45922.1 GNAT family N-acetyltransferase [Alkalicoccobacillus porphyridii]
MIFRKAIVYDLPEIVRMLADDELGSKREQYEDPLPTAYYEAFQEMENQQGNQVLVAVENEQLLGFLQLTFIPGLSRLGMKRAQIEGVRVDQKHRGKGVGEKLFKEAISLSKKENCSMVELTTDKKRKDAHRFYERLGFESSHDGMKLHLKNPS